MNYQTQKTDAVELRRGDEIVSSFLGAFGKSLKETRLTASLGYLIALKPEVFRHQFEITGRIESVSLEALHNQDEDHKDRSDILVKSTDGLAVVEAKVDATDPSKQIDKYDAKWKVLLTQYWPTKKQQQRKPRIKYLRWQDIADLIKRNNPQFSRGKEQFVSKDLITYLKDHNMILDDQAKEIFARDINNETVNLFLDGHLYCNAKAGGRNEPYFAPYFGKKVPGLRPGLQIGFSYIAKVLKVHKVENFADATNVWKRVKKEKPNFNGKLDELKIIQKWSWREPRFLLFLSTPRLAFDPPITKTNIQKHPGNLQTRSYSFDEFYRAWRGEKIYKSPKAN